MKTKSKNKKKFFLWVLVGMILIPSMLYVVVRLEGGKPSVNIDLPLRSLGVSSIINGKISDTKSGVRSIWIALSRDGNEKVLFEKTFSAKGLLRKGLVTEENFRLKIEPQKLGFNDGPALLRIRVSDYSWRGWFSGNVEYIEKELHIDTTPPEIDILSRNHNLVRGGSGLIIFKVTEADARTGVKVGDNFFPAYPGYFSDNEIFVCLFALNHKQGPGTNMHVEAMDQAGNTAKAGFMHYIGKKPFKKDRIGISDRFLNSKMPGFRVEGFDEASANNLEKFLKINRDMRQDNAATIMGPGGKTDRELYWTGPFLRLPGSATRASYADHRSYIYKNKIIDKQYHLGIDLASVKHAPVPAANKGKVALVDNIGIYGRTVVIDHGFGLFSTYSHLSRVNVIEGQDVSKADILGRTGITGLVGGDHLHYGMFIHNVFVNPVEWWDATWIENNILSKLSEVRSEM